MHNHTMPSKAWFDVRSGMWVTAPETDRHDSTVRRLVQEEIADTIAHLQSEIAHWRSMYYDLQIEMECMLNAFPSDDNTVNPKRSS